MRERIEPPASPSQSSRCGIARLTALLDDDPIRPRTSSSSPRAMSPTKEKSPNSGRIRDSPLRENQTPPQHNMRLDGNATANNAIANNQQWQKDDSSEYEDVHNAIESSDDDDDDKKYEEEVTVENKNRYEDLSISSGSIPSKLSKNNDKTIADTALPKTEHPLNASKDDRHQFEKDVAALDAKLSKNDTDSDSTEEEDVEMQQQSVNDDPPSYHKLVGPLVDDSGKCNIMWKTSAFFLPCLFVLLFVIIMTPTIMKLRNEKAQQALAESSIIPTTTPSSSPSVAVGGYPSTSSSPFATGSPLIPRSTLSPTQTDATTNSSSCSAATFSFSTESSVMILFREPSLKWDDCSTRPLERMSAMQRLNCFGTGIEYRPAGFVPNRFGKSDQVEFP